VRSGNEVGTLSQAGRAGNSVMSPSRCMTVAASTCGLGNRPANENTDYRVVGPLRSGENVQAAFNLTSLINPNEDQTEITFPR
jgi:hypothetical protein